MRSIAPRTRTPSASSSAGRDDLAVANVGQGGRREPAGGRRRCGEGRGRRERAAPLELGGRSLRVPYDIGQEPAATALGPLLVQELGHVVQERRGQGQV